MMMPGPETVYGLPVPNIREDCIPVGVVVLVKSVNPMGEVTYFEVASSDLSPMEQVGMTTTYLDTLRENLMLSRRKTN
jgi:hypothetical protein